MHLTIKVNLTNEDFRSISYNAEVDSPVIMLEAASSALRKQLEERPIAEVGVQAA